jgi:hypothetical protein
VDLDCDGDLDIVTGNGLLGLGHGAYLIHPEPFAAFLNDGRGVFSQATSAVFPPGVEGYGFDVAAGDLDGDGALDLYLASRRRQDLLLLSSRGEACPLGPCDHRRPRRPSGRLGAGLQDPRKSPGSRIR